MYSKTVFRGCGKKAINILSSTQWCYFISSHDLRAHRLCQVYIRNIMYNTIQLLSSKETPDHEGEGRILNTENIETHSTAPNLKPDALTEPANTEKEITRIENRWGCSVSEVVKQPKKEKRSFVKLYKTSQQTKKGQNLTEEEVPSSEKTTKSSELAWVLKTSSSKYLRVVKLRQTDSNKDKSSDNDSQIYSNHNVTKNKQTNATIKLDTSSDTKSHADGKVPNISTSIVHYRHNKSNDETKLVETLISPASNDREFHETEATHLSKVNNDSSINCDDKTKKDIPVLKHIKLTEETLEDITSFPLVYSTKNTHVCVGSESIVTDQESYVRLPSVTKILQKTMSPDSRLSLQIWEQNMIQKLGQEGFLQYRTELLEDSKMLHKCIESTLLFKNVAVPVRLQPAYRSLEHVFKDINDVVSVETNVTHPNLLYKGVVDCIASYRGKRYVIDWKKSEKKKPTLKSTYDAPIQVAAYAGAINTSECYPFMIERALIIIAHTNGEPAKVHEINFDTLQKYWGDWLIKLKQYYASVLEKPK